MGCIPLLHYEPDLYVYFCMSNFDIDDIFYLMSGKHYMETLETNINNFNEFVSNEKLKRPKE
jgi:hypothetical protein